MTELTKVLSNNTMIAQVNINRGEVKKSEPFLFKGCPYVGDTTTFTSAVKPKNAIHKLAPKAKESLSIIKSLLSKDEVLTPIITRTIGGNHNAGETVPANIKMLENGVISIDKPGSMGSRDNYKIEITPDGNIRSALRVHKEYETKPDPLVKEKVLGPNRATYEIKFNPDGSVQSAGKALSSSNDVYTSTTTNIPEDEARRILNDTLVDYNEKIKEEAARFKVDKDERRIELKRWHDRLDKLGIDQKKWDSVTGGVNIRQLIESTDNNAKGVSTDKDCNFLETASLSLEESDKEIHLRTFKLVPNASYNDLIEFNLDGTVKSAIRRTRKLNESTRMIESTDSSIPPEEALKETKDVFTKHFSATGSNNHPKIFIDAPYEL